MRRAVAGVASGARTRTKLTVLLRCRSLDRRIAAGSPTDLSPAVALRAQQLRSSEERCAVAACLELALDLAEDRVAHGHASDHQLEVVGARTELRALADRLRDSREVAARGVALTQLLVSDASGPLFRADASRPLAEALREAADAL